MKKILQSYVNMGDCAKQISVLEDKMKNKNFTGMKGVGGAIIDTEEDAQYMVNLQWARIRTLEDALSKPEEETRLHVKDLRDSMCNDCIMNIDTEIAACQKDYTKMTLYKTILEVLQ